jgi:hypothetical protein
MSSDQLRINGSATRQWHKSNKAVAAKRRRDYEQRKESMRIPIGAHVAMLEHRMVAEARRGAVGVIVAERWRYERYYYSIEFSGGAVVEYPRNTIRVTEEQ